jgi:hypothetical protein
MPHLELFEQLVLPAVRCLQRRQTRQRHERASSPRDGRDSITPTQATGGPR